MSGTFDSRQWLSDLTSRASGISTEPQFLRSVERTGIHYAMQYGRYATEKPAQARARLRTQAAAIRDALETIGTLDAISDIVTLLNEDWERIEALEDALPALGALADGLEMRAKAVPRAKPRTDFRLQAARQIVAMLRAEGLQPTAHSSAYGSASTAVNLLVLIASASGDVNLSRESARKLIATALRCSENSPAKKRM